MRGEKRREREREREGRIRVRVRGEERRGKEGKLFSENKYLRMILYRSEWKQLQILLDKKMIIGGLRRERKEGNDEETERK